MSTNISIHTTSETSLKVSHQDNGNVIWSEIKNDNDSRVTIFFKSFEHRQSFWANNIVE